MKSKISIVNVDRCLRQCGTELFCFSNITFQKLCMLLIPTPCECFAAVFNDVLNVMLHSL